MSFHINSITPVSDSFDPATAQNGNTYTYVDAGGGYDTAASQRVNDTEEPVTSSHVKTPHLTALDRQLHCTGAMQCDSIWARGSWQLKKDRSWQLKKD